MHLRERGVVANIPDPPTTQRHRKKQTRDSDKNMERRVCLFLCVFVCAPPCPLEMEAGWMCVCVCVCVFHAATALCVGSGGFGREEAMKLISCPPGVFQKSGTLWV